MKVAVGVMIVLAAVALAGCTSSETAEANGFKVKAPDAPGGTYTFTASSTADSYEWDLGDRLSTATGKTVEHAYDFMDGTITVKLTTTTAGVEETFKQTVIVGSGENGNAPGLVLEASTNWTIPGEQVSFTGASSVDADGDNLRYTWNCIRTGDAVRQAAHTHAGGGGVPFATPGAGSGLSRVSPGPMPAVDIDLGTDACTGMQDMATTTDPTIGGSFSESGIYDVTLIGSDGPHPTISTKFTIYVTDAEDRPEQNQTFLFEGTFIGGAGGSVGGAVGQVSQGNETFDVATHRFSLPIAAKSFDMTCSATGGLGTITCQVLKGGNAQHEATADGWTTENLKDGSYEVEVRLVNGAQVSYAVEIDATLNMTPSNYF